jgi:sugar O-acyltransferase (sialic acid O-acetyltransferase NeuD family)
MKKIILIGAGGHCVSCIDVIEQEKKFSIYGLIDNINKKKMIDYKIIGKDINLKNIFKKIKYAFITMGQIKNMKYREEIFNKVSKIGYIIPNIISPKSYVSNKASIGKGSIVMHGAIVNAGAKIGKNCIINSKSLIEHNVTIGDNCHISTGAIINGQSEIKKNTFVGSGSVVKQNIIIGENCFINANIFIDKNLKENLYV